MDTHRIATDQIAATIAAHGAELTSLQGGGTEFLWQAGPVWPRHAPVLFPIVGRLKGDVLRHRGQSYRLTQHGFARDRRFAWEHTGPADCRLALTDDPQTREMYPFPFRLVLTYAVAGARLTQNFAVTNTGDAPLPASWGAHPAFAWPLRPGVAKTDHTLTFEVPETGPVRRLQDGLMVQAAAPNPIAGRTLALDEALFGHDAIILEQPASRSVTYAARGGPSLTVGWSGIRELGLWSKPGDFVCIEPWRGHASPADFDGAFEEKPGITLVPPGETVTSSVTITISSNPD